VRTIIETTTDDLDGSPDAHTVAFSLDGRQYEIDLSGPNIDKLYTMLQPYIDNGRRAPARITRPPHRRTPPNGAAKDIRRWWHDNPDGLPTWQAKGAIPFTVQHAHQHRPR
jgi:hypothetical protein